ncbi:uncharacterized protein SAPINGB_P003157 [Magnusiomyces paraingens]|uniref:Major facilitator superfamily (MFS) profile domain-containing protein n=1 Tax=Magnusiomyces paraingens TaxID=2606893 RepID=A0A5E8BK32_9ASCO|nr:uncharacterized protein SAPINGB_P003157 [Saprochaete ingens]VVT51621.1 unnamed protein product [Saprochaete ingens]
MGLEDQKGAITEVTDVSSDKKYPDVYEVEDVQETLDFSKMDKAAQIMHGSNINLDEVDPKVIAKLTRKVDMMILPFIFVSYIFFYVDKTTLSYAAIFGIVKDLNLTGSKYSWLSSLFYFGFLFWSFPTNYLMLKFPIGKYLGINIFLWGVLLMIQAACNSFKTLAVLRVLGGAAEACADPAFMLITGMWYTRRQQPLRIGIWFSATGVGVAFGGLLGYAIGNIKGSLPSWKYEFLVIGALCATWGLVVFFFLPDSPVTSKYLTEDERVLLLTILKSNQTGIENKTLKWDQVKECLMDIKVWLLFFGVLGANVPNGGYSNFGTIIIKGLGFSTLGTTLLSIPYGASIAFSILICVYLNHALSRNGENRRVVLLAIFILPNVAGTFGLYFLPQTNKAGRLICYYLTGPGYASFVLVLSLFSGNVAGHTKRTVANTIMFLGYCIGNLIGPFFYLDSQKPKYPLGIGSMLTGVLLSGCTAIILGFYLKWCNKRRDEEQGGRSTDLSNSFKDMTDKQNKNFRYIY